MFSKDLLGISCRGVFGGWGRVALLACGVTRFTRLWGRIAALACVGAFGLCGRVAALACGVTFCYFGPLNGKAH